ncbi:MAG: SsrA-binding protein SmpB [Candidatus Woesebacteria bacterium]
MTPLIENRKARRDYAILDTLEAGIVLSGQEVKSLRAKRANISEAFVRVLSNEVFLVNAHIQPLLTVAHVEYEPTQSRKLLLKKKQIKDLEVALHTKGLTAVPLMIGLQKNYIKVLVGIGKGKKVYERKEELKKRDLKREESRELRGKR